MSLSPTLPYSQASMQSGIRIDRLANAAIAVAVFSGGFVIFEPAPYEVLLAGLLAIFFLLGMRVPREILPMWQVRRHRPKWHFQTADGPIRR